MKDQKRFLIAIILALAVMIVYSALFSPKKPLTVEPQKTQPAIEEKKVEHPLAQKKKTTGITSPTTKQKKTEEQTIKTPLIEALLTNQGASIKDLYLNRRQTRKKEKAYHLMASQKPDQNLFNITELNGMLIGAAVYDKEPAGNNAAEYVYNLPQGIRISKKYIFHKSNYSIDLQIKLTNLSKSDKVVSYTLVGPGQIDRSGQLDKRFTNGGLSLNGHVQWLKLPKPTRTVEIPGSPDWLTLRNAHYSIILAPKQLVALTEIRGVKNKKGGKNWLWSIKTKEQILPPGSSITQKYTLYAGATTERELAPLGLAGATNYGKLNIFCQPLIKTLNFLYKTTRNYGVAIILLVFVINVIIYPLTLKNIKSMRKMQAIQPHLAKLKEKHKGDQQKLQVEMMKLYREQQVNPLGGCLPMLIQMPIFFALYITLARSAELGGSNFLWIKDLSQPDTLAKLPFSIPFLGNALNLLPIIMVFAMILQQKTSTSMGTKATKNGEDSTQQQQQKMMMFMPLIFGVILYNLPSGLVLYWTVNTLFMATMQYIITRRLSTEEEPQGQG